MEKQNDRVTIGFSRKVTDGKYGSYDVHCSMGTDVIDGEVRLEVAKRLTSEIKSFISEEIDAILNKTRAELTNTKEVK